MSQNRNQVRIIGGLLKRKLLSFHDADGLRPTPDRLRETLFNWLMWDINQAHVLDLYSGSGALGFECISRGASSVTMCELNHKQASILKKNLSSLPVELQTNHKIIQADAQVLVKELITSKQSYDLIFIDPPYALNLWQSICELINPLLHQRSLIYVESDQPHERIQLPQHWHLKKSTKIGNIYAGLYTIN